MRATLQWNWKSSEARVRGEIQSKLVTISVKDGDLAGNCGLEDTSFNAAIALAIKF
jgi:hypothetical protein